MKNDNQAGIRDALVGVVGAGVMGVGVAQLFAENGFSVVLVDNDSSVLSTVESRIRESVRLGKLLGRKGIDNDATVVMSRITVSDQIESLASVDVVIENITEDWDLKSRFYPELDRVCHSDSIFAANTSAIPIGRIATRTRRAPKVIGIHFMNPVPMKKAAEVIPCTHTAPETTDWISNLLREVGVEPIVVGDAPGFVSNRVLMLTINEAIFLVHEGVADPHTVDDVFRKCFGHPMGPLATADLIGLDTILRSLEVLLTEMDDPKFTPCPLLVEMVREGNLGRKSGTGFHSY